MAKRRSKISPNRKASAPLHVMLEPEDLERFKQLAAARDMTLRDLVRSSLDTAWQQHQAMSVEPSEITSTGRIIETGPVALTAAGNIAVRRGPGLGVDVISGVSISGLERRMLTLSERVSRLESASTDISTGMMINLVRSRAHLRALSRYGRALDGLDQQKQVDECWNFAYSDVVCLFSPTLRNVYAEQRGSILEMARGPGPF